MLTLAVFALGMMAGGPGQTPAAEQQAVPAACLSEEGRDFDARACADAAPAGSPARSLALINLATRAYISGDFAMALGLYDEAVPPGLTISSDIIFHTFRADTYERAGRTDAALADAELAWRILKGEVSPSGNPANDIPVDDTLRFEVLIRILPILQRGGSEAFAPGRALLTGLPVEGGVGLTNRAALLANLGDHDAAVADSLKALADLPDEPGVLNNHCHILTEAGRAVEGLEYCRRAVEALPGVAVIRHSHAEALAAVGRCAEAERELAEARRLDPTAVRYAEALTCKAVG